MKRLWSLMPLFFVLLAPLGTLADGSNLATPSKACAVRLSGTSMSTVPAGMNSPLALQVPEPDLRMTCNAYQSCASGCDVACSGSSLCEVGATYVRCDGVQFNCTSCTPPVDCLDPCGYCDCKAAGGTNLACSRGYCLACWPLWQCEPF